MELVAITCGLAGLLLGMIADVRALALTVAFAGVVAFFSAVGTGESILTGMSWTITGLVTLQVGYVVAVVVRATWFAETGDVRQSVPSP